MSSSFSYATSSGLIPRRQDLPVRFGCPPSPSSLRPTEHCPRGAGPGIPSVSSQSQLCNLVPQPHQNSLVFSPHIPYILRSGRRSWLSRPFQKWWCTSLGCLLTPRTQQGAGELGQPLKAKVHNQEWTGCFSGAACWIWTLLELQSARIEAES